MARIYSVDFSPGQCSAPAVLPMFTVPAGHVYVVRDGDFLTTGVLSGCSMDLQYSTASDPSDYIPFVELGLGLPYDTYRQWTGRQVFPEGYSCQCVVINLTGQFQGKVSGYDLGP